MEIKVQLHTFLTSVQGVVQLNVQMDKPPGKGHLILIGWVGHKWTQELSKTYTLVMMDTGTVQNI